MNTAGCEQPQQQQQQSQQQERPSALSNYGPI